MSFNRLAPHYRWMERVLAGDRLQRARLRWVNEPPPPRRVLLVGEGPGRFLEAALRVWPAACFDCLDASEAMLAQARARVSLVDAGRVRFQRVELPGWCPEPEIYDGLVTHCFLDCFPPQELARVVANLAFGAAPVARWWLADFAVPERGWRRMRARAIHRLMYGFFRRATGLRAASWVPPEPFLQAHGFSRIRIAESEWGLIRSSLWRRGLSQNSVGRVS